MIADLLTAYTQRQLCAIEEEDIRPNKFVSQDRTLPNPDELEDIPRVSFAFSIIFNGFIVRFHILAAPI